MSVSLGAAFIGDFLALLYGLAIFGSWVIYREDVKR